MPSYDGHLWNDQSVTRSVVAVNARVCDALGIVIAVAVFAATAAFLGLIPGVLAAVAAAVVSGRILAKHRK